MLDANFSVSSSACLSYKACSSDQNQENKSPVVLPSFESLLNSIAMAKLPAKQQDDGASLSSLPHASLRDIVLKAEKQRYTETSTSRHTTNYQRRISRINEELYKFSPRMPSREKEVLSDEEPSEAQVFHIPEIRETRDGVDHEQCKIICKRAAEIFEEHNQVLDRLKNHLAWDMDNTEINRQVYHVLAPFAQNVGEEYIRYQQALDKDPTIAAGSENLNALLRVSGECLASLNPSKWGGRRAKRGDVTATVFHMRDLIQKAKDFKAEKENEDPATRHLCVIEYLAQQILHAECFLNAMQTPMGAYLDEKAKQKADVIATANSHIVDSRII